VVAIETDQPTQFGGWWVYRRNRWSTANVRKKLYLHIWSCISRRHQNV